VIPRRALWSVILAAGLILTAAGYWGPWVAHKAAALVIPGVDLAEYVKFLPEYRRHEIRILREGFYLPLVALSLSLSLLAWQPAARWPMGLRALAWACSISATLAMLPPAWSPVTFRQPEFRLQIVAIVVCLIIAAVAPLLRRVRPAYLSCVLVPLSLFAAFVPVWQFGIVRPALDKVYGRPITIGWGPVVMTLGLILLALGWVGLSRSERRNG